MRKLLSILLLFSATIYSQSRSGPFLLRNPDPQTALTFTNVSFSSTGLLPNYFSNVEQWHGGNDVDIPVNGVSSPRSDAYYRSFYQWSNIETGYNTYDWTVFDNDINTAIDNNQKFSFGYITEFPGPPDAGFVTFNGGYSSYPQYLHDSMQLLPGTNKDFKTNGSVVVTTNDVANNIWVANCNSAVYIRRLAAWLRAWRNHIYSTSHSGVLYANAINYIDIRGFGAYGEGHMGGILSDVTTSPSGTNLTAAARIEVIDSVVAIFSEFPLMALIAEFNGTSTSIPIFVQLPEVGYHLLTISNNWGKIGWRRDQWGYTDSYLSDLLENNTTVYDPAGAPPAVAFDTAIMNRYHYAPITGEPGGGSQMTALPAQARLYHGNSFGNSNYNIVLSTASKDSIRLAAKIMGNRIQVDSGSCSTTITKGVQFSVTLKWENSGYCPPYENSIVTFQLVNAGGTTVWKDTSTMVLKFFQPGATQIVTDYMTIPGSVTSATYSLRLKIEDANAYRTDGGLIYNSAPSRQTDGSYILRSSIVL